jgi:DNA-binding LacI/PurR family transcriptional regulator
MEEEKKVSIHEKLQIDPNASLPIVAQIQQQITWLLASGTLKAGDRLPPIRELAEQLGVHMHTIRFAYQHLESEGLVSTRRGRGTIVLEHGARLLRFPGGNVRSNTIGVLVPGLNPFYLPLLRGIEDASRELPALVLLSNTNDNPLRAEIIIQQMITKNVDGLILVSTGFDWIDVSDSSPPIIFIDEPYVNKNVILFDSEGAAYKVTKHLIEHGYSEIALITVPMIIPQVQAVYQGFQRALQENGLPLVEKYVLEVPDFSSSSGYHAMQKFLKTGERPRAVFAIADILAVGALRAIKEQGLQVPHDIALVGYNDIELADLLNPPLTTIAVPTYEAGFQAVESLVTLRAGQSLSSSKTMLETHLVIRQSCGCCK